MLFPVLGLGIPPCWRAYFLLLRQKKVAKEKATPGSAVGYADSPTLLEAGGGCGTRATPSDSPRPYPPASALLGAAHGDPKSKTSRSQVGFRVPYGSVRVVFPGPLRGAEQRRAAGGSRLALSEPQASLASRPADRVAQGTRAAGTDPGVTFSLATFFWANKRKYARQQGGTPSQ
jgi:hypothetical protein